MIQNLPIVRTVALSFAGLALLSLSSTEARELMLKKDDPELDELLDALYQKLAGKQEELQETARAAVKPMTHKLSIIAK